MLFKNVPGNYQAINMNINLHNYEEFFLLYADNELPAAARAEVEAFVQQHPDLKKELELFTEFKMTPDNNILFPGKESLLKPENREAGINTSNYEMFFVQYHDDELTNAEKAMVEEFVYSHPQFQSDFELIQQVKLEPESSIVFPNKESLYRKEEDDDKVIPFRWWRLAVAALLLIAVGIWWLTNNNNKPNKELVKNSQEKQQPANTKKGDTNNGNQLTPQTEKEAIAVVKENADKNNSREKNNRTAVQEEQNRRNKENKVQLALNKKDDKENSIQVKEKELIAQNETGRDNFKSSNINGTKEPGNDIAVNANIPSTAKEPIIDQQTKFAGADETNNKNIVTYASLNNEDNVQVLNTSMNRKNNLRGFLRKASRFISKKSSLGNDDGNRKGILIGGFEIAVK